MQRGDSSAQIVRNKRFVKRARVASTATAVTPNLASADHHHYSALASNLTVNNPIGTPHDGDTLYFRIKDNGTIRTITWGSEFRGAMLTATVVGKTQYAIFKRNHAETKWDCIINIAVP